MAIVCALALVLLGALGPRAARAQNAAAAPSGAAQPDATAPSQPIQEVVITGSRIPVPANITSTSPITTITAQQIQLQGKTDTTELINALPQNIISSGADLGNNQNPLTAAGGVATADLRGLGPQRTLVLVDGKRLGIGDPDPENPNPAPDLDQIPTALIERIDVVTGGASAVYGADAVAGVINFILKKNFQGIQIDGQYGFYTHDNGESAIQAIDAQTQTAVGPTNPPFTAPSGGVMDGYKRDLSILVGTNTADGRGNITGYLTYHHQDPITEGSRDYSNCLLVTNSLVGASAVPNGWTCLGTSNSNLFAPQTGPNAGNDYSVVGNQLLPYPQVGSSPPSQFNPNPYQYMQREDDRYNAGFMGHIDLNDYVEPYVTATFMDDRSTELSGPSGLFQSSYPFTPDNFYRVNCNNPLLSAQEAATLGCTAAMIAAPASDANLPTEQVPVDIGRRNIEGGPRVSYWNHINYRLVVGSRGELAPGITYDAYAQYYYVSLFLSNSNYLNYANVGQALIAVPGSTPGQAVCSNPVGGCVPYDIFTQGGVTPAQLAYLQTPGTGYGTSSEGTTQVDFTGDLGQYGITSPWAHDGVGADVGADQRYDTYDFTPDAVSAAGELAGYAGAVVAIHAADVVDEGFFEVRAPLMQNRPWVRDLDFDTGYRYSDYSTSGSISTYKFELQYAPVAGIRLRASYDRAIRAPNLFELYSPQSYGQTSIIGTDPCAGSAPTATLAQCERTGVTPAQFGSIPQCVASQCGQVVGGNPQLQPEEADTYSIGLTFRPAGLPNFTGSVDYWHIAEFGLVGSVPANILFNSCLNTGSSFDCSQIVRNPATGALTGATVAGGGYVLQTDINTGSGLTSGIDVQAAYRLGLGRWGAVTADLNGTYLEHSITTPYPGALSYDCAGLFGASCNVNSVNPRWRHTLRVNWDTPWKHLLLSANWRFIGATSFDNNSPNPLLQFAEEGMYDIVNARIPNYSYFDFAAIWPVWHRVVVRGGIYNAFDKDPPVIPAEISGVGAPNTYPTYDLLGREVFVAFSAAFGG